MKTILFFIVFDDPMAPQLMQQVVWKSVICQRYHEFLSQQNISYFLYKLKASSEFAFWYSGCISIFIFEDAF